MDASTPGSDPGPKTDQDHPPRLTRAVKQVVVLGLVVVALVWSLSVLPRNVPARLCGDGPPCKPGIAYVNDVACWMGPGDIGGNGSPRPSGMAECP